MKCSRANDEFGQIEVMIGHTGDEYMHDSPMRRAALSNPQSLEQFRAAMRKTWGDQTDAFMEASGVKTAEDILNYHSHGFPRTASTCQAMCELMLKLGKGDVRMVDMTAITDYNTFFRQLKRFKQKLLLYLVSPSTPPS